MKENWKNTITVEGYIFNFSLAKRKTGEKSKNPGQDYISGTINIATDEEALNVVPVHVYLTPTYGAKTPQRPNPKKNPNYDTVSSFIDGQCSTYEAVGKNATKVRITGELEINDFLGNNGEMVAQKRVLARFINIISDLSGRGAQFEFDMLISSTYLRENSENEPYMQVSGYVFNYQNRILPVTLSTTKGVKYFEDADISSDNPLLINLWGNIISTTVNYQIEKENGFGDPDVRTVSRTLRAWDITGISTEPMEFDSESTITLDELRKLLEDRNIYVAQQKQSAENYRAQSNNSNNGFSVGSVSPSSKAEVQTDKNFVF